MNETTARIRSLWQLALRLRRLTEDTAWKPPIGRERMEVDAQLTSMCDEIERLLWKLGGQSNANP